MQIARVLIVVACALALSACKHKSSQTPVAPLPGDNPDAAAATPPAQPALSDAEFESLMRDTVSFFGAVADAITAAEGDCATMATGIDDVTTKNQDLLTRAHKLDEDQVAADRADAWMHAHKDDVAPIFQRLQSSIGNCAEDQAVQAALQKMGGGT